MQIAQDLSLNQGIKSTCRALDLSRASFYRFLRAKQKPAVFKNVVSALALSINERLTVFNILHSERFIDRAPHEICATLLGACRTNKFHGTVGVSHFTMPVPKCATV